MFLFKKNNKACLLLGSCNLTRSGFTLNAEACVSYETNDAEKNTTINKILNQIDVWHKDKNSFPPEEKWIKTYEKTYMANKQKLDGVQLSSPQEHDNSYLTVSWLGLAQWDIFFNRVSKSMEDRPNTGEGYRQVLAASQEIIPLPWNRNYLTTLESRKLIGGRGDYGWLGNTTASGYFAGLLKSGTIEDHTIIIESINLAASFKAPIEWETLREILTSLFDLGFRMSCWGRLLCLARPDLYPTVSSPKLRRKLSKLLGVTQDSFNEVDGYIKLLKYIHSTPWFNSKKPKTTEELFVWKNRVALLDPIFH